MSETDKKLCTVNIDFDRLEGPIRGDFYKFGRRIAGRFHRDSGVLLGQGVSILSGGFPDSGGSRQYPKLDPLPGTVLVVRDVPETSARDALTEDPGGYSLISGDAEKIIILEDEKERIENKLKKIIKELDILYKNKK